MAYFLINTCIEFIYALFYTIQHDHGDEEHDDHDGVSRKHDVLFLD